MKETFKGIYNGNIWMIIYQYMYLTRKTLWVYAQNDVRRNMDLTLVITKLSLTHIFDSRRPSIVYIFNEGYYFFALASNFTF